MQQERVLQRSPALYPPCKAMASAREQPYPPTTGWRGVWAADGGRWTGMFDGVKQLSSHAYFTVG